MILTNKKQQHTNRKIVLQKKKINHVHQKYFICVTVIIFILLLITDITTRINKIFTLDIMLLLV